MCYSLSHRYLKEYRFALQWGASRDDLAELYRKYLDQYTREWEEQEENSPEDKVYHVSGFEHSPVDVVCHDEEGFVQKMEWGLIPSHTKDEKEALIRKNQTLNARGETIFEKPSFRNSADDKRCVVMVDSFFEYHHVKSKKFPFRIKRKDGKPMCLGGLWDEWTDENSGEVKRTFSIVTTEGNELLAKIHNNPKMTGPRMPLIMSEEAAVQWLLPVESAEDKKRIQKLIKPYADDVLEAYAVHQLGGKNGVGNSPKAHEAADYIELKLDLGGQTTLDF